MRKQVFGRKLQRDANERKALLKGLMNDLVMKEQITTTLPKAKAMKGAVEKLVTKAKVRGENAKISLQQYLQSAAMKKVMTDLAVRFANRPGGYTRIIKLGERFGDNAQMAIIEWVDKTPAVAKVVKPENAKPARKVVAKPAKKTVVKAVKKPVKAKSVRKSQDKKESK